jgi:hypothetical protein
MTTMPMQKMVIVILMEEQNFEDEEKQGYGQSRETHLKTHLGKKTTSHQKDIPVGVLEEGVDQERRQGKWLKTHLP